MVFYSNDSGKGKKSKRNVKCYNCHRKGYYKADCWEEGGGKAGQGPKGKGREKLKEAAASTSMSASAKAKKKEVDTAWMAMSAFINGEVDLNYGSSYVGAPSTNSTMTDPLEELFEAEILVDRLM